MITQGKIMAGIFAGVAMVVLYGAYTIQKGSDSGPPPPPPLVISTPATETLSPGGEGIKKKYPDWLNATCNAVARKEVVLGMDQWQVVAAWGNQASVTKLTTASGVGESWIMYPKGHRSTVFFKDGIVIAIQQ